MAKEDGLKRYKWVVIDNEVSNLRVLELIAMPYREVKNIYLR